MQPHPPVRRAPVAPIFSGTASPQVSRCAQRLQRYVETHPDTALGVSLSPNREAVLLATTLPVGSVNAHLRLPADDLEVVRVIAASVSLQQAEAAVTLVCDLPWQELGVVSVAVNVLSQSVEVRALGAEWPEAADVSVHTAPTPQLQRLVEHLTIIADASGVPFTLGPGGPVHPYA